jgi:cyclic pyranopterin phosphate synthase
MEFSHLDQQGNANMVDITNKQPTSRSASAVAYVYMLPDTLAKVEQQDMSKGDVLSVARIAGIQGAKRCADLIPLCHPLALTKVSIEFAIEAHKNRIRIQSLCKVTGKTGVEMEALTAVSVSALTIFDMCKAIEPGMRISDMHVLTKKGGKSGDWTVSDSE